MVEGKRRKMNCPICKTEMEKGVLGSQNESWIPENTALAKLNWLAQTPTFGQPRLWAYRCPKCGKVELTTEEK
jgi:rubrerythrin